LRTIETIKSLKEKIQDIVLDYYHKGERNFIIVGEGELADIIEISLRDMGREDFQYLRVRTPGEVNSKNSIILLTNRNIQKRNNRLSQYFRNHLRQNWYLTTNSSAHNPCRYRFNLCI